MGPSAENSGRINNSPIFVNAFNCPKKDGETLKKGVKSNHNQTTKLSKITHMIRFFIRLYYLVIIADVILSYFPQYNNEPWRNVIRKMSEAALAPIRKALPPDIPFDFSPFIVILLFELFIALF